MPVSQLATLRVRVPLMDCDACAILIQNKLRQTGIQNAIVTFRTKAAVVRYNPAEVTARNIMNLIDETGFKAEPTTP
ncbi:MAG TPA: heavy metal-associated domain-containing protein [Verrucomicrobiae bacterium]|nr:heavy metal-associated domain-containing protein [Verrucomicrobiae bacterium]